MTNHVHVVAIPHAEDALAKAVGRTHFRYSQYINRCHERSGHLWQGRFYSCARGEPRDSHRFKGASRRPEWVTITRYSSEGNLSSGVPARNPPLALALLAPACYHDLQRSNSTQLPRMSRKGRTDVVRSNGVACGTWNGREEKDSS
jgi:hypothetical protein